MSNETRGTLPGATLLCFKRALLYGQFCCQPLLLVEKLKAMYFTEGMEWNSVIETKIQKGRGQTY